LKKIRRNIWIDPDLLLMVSDKGIDLSTFVSMSLSYFLDLPEDPAMQLLKKTIENAELRVRIRYINELRDRITKVEQTQLVEDTEKAKEKELIAELHNIGNALKKTSCYSKLIESLKNNDPDAPCWDTAVIEVSKLAGLNLEFAVLWNLSIEWYKKCPTEVKA